MASERDTKLLFSQPSILVKESDKAIRIPVMLFEQQSNYGRLLQVVRRGNIRSAASVNYSTAERTALNHRDFVPVGSTSRLPFLYTQHETHDER